MQNKNSYWTSETYHKKQQYQNDILVLHFKFESVKVSEIQWKFTEFPLVLLISI